ncbi:MAG TPA: hypothetical protein ENN57_00660 [Chloroflexi bacterium]|nr:hypothetical protein [Chloroflexota bacterium]
MTNLEEPEEKNVVAGFIPASRAGMPTLSRCNRDYVGTRPALLSLQVPPRLNRGYRDEAISWRGMGLPRPDKSGC